MLISNRFSHLQYPFNMLLYPYYYNPTISPTGKNCSKGHPLTAVSSAYFSVRTLTVTLKRSPSTAISNCPP